MCRKHTDLGRHILPRFVKIAVFVPPSEIISPHIFRTRQSRLCRCLKTTLAFYYNLDVFCTAVEPSSAKIKCEFLYAFWIHSAVIAALQNRTITCFYFSIFTFPCSRAICPQSSFGAVARFHILAPGINIEVIFYQAGIFLQNSIPLISLRYSASGSFLGGLAATCRSAQIKSQPRISDHAVFSVHENHICIVKLLPRYIIHNIMLRYEQRSLVWKCREHLF